MLKIFSKTLIMVFALTVMTNLAKAQIVTEGLVSYWSFDKDTIEGETVKDLWGNNHGTMMNEPEQVNGKYGEALRFTGANHVEVSDSESLDIKKTGEVSVTVWINIDSRTDYGGIVEKGNGGSSDTPLLIREWNDGTIVFEARAEGSEPKWPTNAVIPVGKWTFLAGTVDGKVNKIYVNGELDCSIDYDKGIGQNDDPLRIGWDAFSEERHFHGIIDEVCVYKRALSPSEIRLNQNAGHGLAVEPAGKLSLTWGEIKSLKHK